MAIQQLSLPGEIVKKGNELVRSRISITNVSSSRILAALIAQIRPDDSALTTTYSIDAHKFLVNDGGNSYQKIKNCCRDLASSYAEIELASIYPIISDDDAKFVALPFFGRIQYYKGKINAVFNPTMRDFLFELKGQFTKYNLIEYLQLSTIYSQRLYEILKSYYSQGEVTISLKDLHETLGTPISIRTDFSQFRRRVLESTYKEILKKTHFFYEWFPIKEGRAIVAINFVFTHKKCIPISKSKKIDNDTKRIKKNNAIFKKYTECYAIHGDACTGGHQKFEICELCKKLR